MIISIPLFSQSKNPGFPGVKKILCVFCSLFLLLFSQSENGAPGKVRTCDPRFRRPVLFQLSYECTNDVLTQVAKAKSGLRNRFRSLWSARWGLPWMAERIKRNWQLSYECTNDVLTQVAKAKSGLRNRFRSLWSARWGLPWMAERIKRNWQLSYECIFPNNKRIIDKLAYLAKFFEFSPNDGILTE
jgi:hypothetical protein